MKPVSRWASVALLSLCCAAPAIAGQDRTDLASGTYPCLGGTHQANINELNMSSANGNFNYIEVKVLDANLPRDTKLCYTAKSGGGDFDSICATVGSADIDVWRGGSKLTSPASNTFAAGDYLVLNVKNGNEVNEAILLDKDNKVIDNIKLCPDACSTGYWPIANASCGTRIANVGASVKDVARFPEDGTGGWSSNTLNTGIPANGTVGESNVPAAAAPHHFELRHASGSELSCAASTLTIKACGNAACTLDYTGGVSGTISATGGSVNWDGSTGGAGGAGFAIAANTSSVTKNFQALGTATLGLTGLAPAASTTCNFGGDTPCQFRALSGGFILANSSTSTTDVTIPTQTAGAQSASYYLRALQASTNNPAVCTPVIFNPVSPASVSVTVGYACDDPSSCQGGNLLKVVTDGDPSHATAVPATGGNVNFVFDSTGSASFGLLYEDVGRITVTASKNFTPFTGATTVAFSTAKQFVVKPHHFVLSGITCGTVNNPGATTAGDLVFCRAGANFSVTATARSATGVITKNFGQENPKESVKLTSILVPGLGLSANPSVGGSFGAFTNGVASGNTFSWNEVGIITLTPSVDDPLTPTVETYLDAVGGEVSGTASGNVGRFIPDHFDTGVIQPAIFTYSGQPFTSVTVTAMSVGGTTTANFNKDGFAKDVTLTAPASPAPVAPPVEPGALTANAPSKLPLPAADFLNDATRGSLTATGTVLYTFTNKLTAPTVVKLHATYTEDNGGNPISVTSGTTEGSATIRSGRLRLSNAFGRANANLIIPMRAEYWTGQSWLLNNLDNFSLIPAGAVALTPTGVTGVSVVAPVPPVALVNGQGSIVLQRPDPGTTGSVDVAVNLGSLASDQSCLALPRPGTTGAALPWLRSQNGQNANCAANSFDRDPSARGNFGIFSPETKKVIHIRELFN